MKAETGNLSSTRRAPRSRPPHESVQEISRHFVESLEEVDHVTSRGATLRNDDGSEARLTIMDWWTKSTYAYLNQTAGSSETPRKRITDYNKKRSSNYTPNCFTFKSPPAILGIF